MKEKLAETTHQAKREVTQLENQATLAAQEKQMIDDKRKKLEKQVRIFVRSCNRSRFVIVSRDDDSYEKLVD
jgi:hypothetical protein